MRPYYYTNYIIYIHSLWHFGLWINIAIFGQSRGILEKGLCPSALNLFLMWWFPLFPVCEQSVYFVAFAHANVFWLYALRPVLSPCVFCASSLLLLVSRGHPWPFLQPPWNSGYPSPLSSADQRLQALLCSLGYRRSLGSAWAPGHCTYLHLINVSCEECKSLQSSAYWLQASNLSISLTEMNWPRWMPPMLRVCALFSLARGPSWTSKAQSYMSWGTPSWQSNPMRATPRWDHRAPHPSSRPLWVPNATPGALHQTQNTHRLSTGQLLHGNKCSQNRTLRLVWVNALFEPLQTATVFISWTCAMPTTSSRSRRLTSGRRHSTPHPP